MKIVMLGHTGVGKTSYMASLYGAMQQTVGGFRLKAAEKEHHSLWIALAESIRLGKYPLSTDQRNVYDFRLRYQGRDVIRFSWADYRGGAIREKQESKQANSLTQDLKAADGILLFCDCNALNKGDLRSNQIGRMIALIGNALEDLEKPISLGIVFTKVDLVKEFTEKLIAPFNGLISAITLSNQILGALIPVACGPQLCNVPMPLLFILQSTVQLQATSTYQSYEKYTSQAQAHEQNSQGVGGAIDWALSRLSGELTHKEQAQFEREKAAEQLREFESIKHPAESLAQYVQKLPLIQPGREVYQYLEGLSQSKQGIISNSFDSIDPFSIFN